MASSSASSSFGTMTVKRGVNISGSRPRKPQARGISFAGGGVKPAKRGMGGNSLRPFGKAGSSRSLVRRGLA